MSMPEGEFKRITKGPHKEEFAQSLATVGLTLARLDLGTDKNLPTTKDVALNFINGFERAPLPISEGVSGGDRFENSDEYEIWGVMLPSEVDYVSVDDLDYEPSDSEIIETEERGEVVANEADLSQAIMAEDECGYGLWSEKHVEYDGKDKSDERLDKGDLHFKLSERDTGIVFFGNTLDTDSITMMLDYAGVDGPGFEEHKETAKQNLQRNLNAVSGAQYKEETENRFNVEISLDGDPEEISERVENAYIAAREAVKYREFR